MDELLISFSVIVALSRAFQVSLGGDNTPSGASAVATSLDASTGFPVGHIIIVGEHVKIIMLTTNKRWNYIITPPTARRGAANDGLDRSLSHKDQGVATKSCDGGATAFPVTIAVTVAYAAATVVSYLPASCCVDASASRPLDFASTSQCATSAYRGPTASVRWNWNLSSCLPLVCRQVVTLSV